MLNPRMCTDIWFSFFFSGTHISFKQLFCPITAWEDIVCLLYYYDHICIISAPLSISHIWKFLKDHSWNCISLQNAVLLYISCICCPGKKWSLPSLSFKMNNHYLAVECLVAVLSWELTWEGNIDFILPNGGTSVVGKV